MENTKKEKKENMQEMTHEQKEQKRQEYTPFKKAICDFLRKKAESEPEFKEKIKNPEKSIDRCLEYIISEVQRMKRVGYADEEIYCLAIHYYDEPDDKLGKIEKTGNCKVVVNQAIELSEEEKEKAKKEAYERMVKEEKERMEAKKRNEEEKMKKEEEKKKKAAEEKAKKQSEGMLSLFD